MKRVKAHKFDRDDHDFYVEPSWTSERLFDEESFSNLICDPACGWGRILLSAQKHGKQIRGSDIVDRGANDPPISVVEFRELCFLSLAPDEVYQWWGACDIVSNPPFDIFQGFADLCCDFMRSDEMKTNKVALLWLVRRLPAAHWLRKMPLSKILLLTPRPSMPTGQYILDGGKVGGGTQDFCWLVFERDHPPNAAKVGWLHRDEREVT